MLFEEEREENQGWEDGLSGELSPNHDQEARQPAEPAVMREEATDEESDDSGPPGLMDMDGNIVSSSSEDEEDEGDSEEGEVEMSEEAEEESVESEQSEEVRIGGEDKEMKGNLKLLKQLEGGDEESDSDLDAALD